MTVIKVLFERTISTSRILSTPRPFSGAKGPWPPPMDHPITPTVDAHPDDINLPLSAAAL